MRRPRVRPPLSTNAWLRWDLARLLLEPLDVRTVLEVGAGEGAVGARLAATYDYVGLEPDPVAHAVAAARLRAVGRGRLLRGDLSALGPGETFDLVCAFEVLEHLEDDAAALAEWRERIRPGGWLLLSTPAHKRRFAAQDRHAGHFRRYDPPVLERLLRDAGLVEPVVLASGFPLGYALEAARNLIAARAAEPASMAERTARSGRWLQPPDALAWLTAGVAAPFRLLQRPFAPRGLGTGLVARARRPA